MVNTVKINVLVSVLQSNEMTQTTLIPAIFAPLKTGDTSLLLICSPVATSAAANF